MNTERPLQRVLVTGAVASAATTAAALALGKYENGSPASLLNATSHIVWGEGAARHDELDFSHTAIGAALNAAAMMSWATVQVLAFPRVRSVWGGLAVGATVSALAYLTDYHVVPKRLTPGFESRVSSQGLFGIYAVLAAALGASAWLLRRRGGRAA